MGGVRIPVIPVTVCAAARPHTASLESVSQSLKAIQQGRVADSTLLSPRIFGKSSTAPMPFGDLKLGPPFWERQVCRSVKKCCMNRFAFRDPFLVAT